jgi:hypothetical protein
MGVRVGIVKAGLDHQDPPAKTPTSNFWAGVSIEVASRSRINKTKYDLFVISLPLG